MSKKLSIVILNWNSKEDLRNCLRSIDEGTSLRDREVIVVDNGSTDGSPDFIKDNYPEVVLIENTKNRGVGPARNQGIAVAQGRFVLILDVDTEVQIGAIDRMVWSMERHPKVGLIGARMVDPNGSLQYTCREFPTVLSKFLFRRAPGRFAEMFLEDEEYRRWDHRAPAYVGYVIGANQLIRKECLDKIGAYDDRIFYGPEDMDYCLRLWRAGWKVMYDPKAQIVHHEHRITKKGLLKQLKNPIFWAHLKGLMIYFGKHRYLFRRPGPFFEILD